jgi:hypothetical protein
VEVEYHIRPEDYQDFERYHRRQGPPPAGGSKWGAVVYFLVLVLLAGFLLWQQGGDRQSGPVRAVLVGLLAFGLGFVGGWVTLLLTFGRQNRLVYRDVATRMQDPRTRWLFESRRLKIDPEGVHVDLPQQYVLSRWPVICHVGATADHVFFYDTPTTAHIVPRRVFPDQEGFDAFVALARRLRDEYPRRRRRLATTLTTVEIPVGPEAPPNAPGMRS